MSTVKDRDCFVRLSSEQQSDLFWWSEFMVRWNGIGMISNPQQALVKLESDASGKWGCAAVWETQWLQ